MSGVLAWVRVHTCLVVQPLTSHACGHSECWFTFLISLHLRIPRLLVCVSLFIFIFIFFVTRRILS